MKITAFLLFCSLVNIFAAPTYSQATRISLHLKDATIEEVLNKIEDVSDFYFLYNIKLIDVTRKVNIEADNEPIKDILNDILNKDTKFTVYDKQIIITPSYVMSSLSPIQQQRITGTVTDEKGNPLPGVTVLVKGTTNGDLTDASGKYALNNVTQNATLIFSFVGMSTQEISSDGRMLIDVMLKEAAIGLEEVVVIGYGTVKKMDLTGSVSTVQGENLTAKNSVQVSQALQGTMPGVMITRTSGASDASATINIRGITTIGNSSPLIIIDGIPSNDIDWINPNDIESISVLKDAASASIYGSRAAAGVILVTTKKAKAGQLSINYNYEYSVEQPTRVAQYVDAQEYMKVFNESTWNDNNNIPGNEYPIFSKETIDNYPALHVQNPDQNPNVSWINLMLKDFAPQESHRLSLTAGTEKIKTYFSLNYDKTEALENGRNYDRITVRSNNDITINKYLSMIVNLNTIYSINNSAFYKGGYYGLHLGPLAAPIYAAIWSNGSIAAGKTGRNDYALLNYGGFQKGKDFMPSAKFQLDFAPIDGLKLSAVFSPEMFYDNVKAFRKQLTYTNWQQPDVQISSIEGAASTYLNESRNNNYSITTQFLSNYVKRFDKHNFNLMLGYEGYHFFQESLSSSSDQMALNDFPYLDLSNNNYLNVGGNAYENAYRSYFGRFMYNFNDKYLFQTNLRYDGSSRFAKDYRWGLFPSFSAGWVVSKESLMKNINYLSFLKIRASWGALGNERIGNYPYQSTIGFGNALYYNSNAVSSVQTAGVADYAIQNISWEKTETLDFGFDCNFFKDKLTVTGDYFKKITKDMLLPLAIPAYIGLANPNQNAGRMNTTGWEIALGWNDKIGDLKYSVTANIFDSKSVMGDLAGTQFLGDQVKFKGSEFNEWYGFKSDGLYQTQDEVDNSATLNSNVKPGDIKYLDISGPNGVPDGKISPEYDKVLLGGSLPRYLYGGSINLGYKNFDFSLVFQGVGKQICQITPTMVEPLQLAWEDVPQIYFDNYWSTYNSDVQNQKAKYPRLSQIGISNNYVLSDFWLFNGAYFRLQNINLGYNIPKMIIEKAKLQNARVYASIRNLFSLDHYPKGWDPEASSYWITRAFIIGFSVEF